MFISKTKQKKKNRRTKHIQIYATFELPFNLIDSANCRNYFVNFFYTNKSELNRKKIKIKWKREREREKDKKRESKNK